MPEPTLADLLWSAPRAPRRGPRPRIELAGIVAAAVTVADADGMEAASMQRVAEALGVTKMALYRHVPGRAELVALMVEAAFAPPPTLPAGWRDGLRAWADAMRVAATRHPWLAVATAGGRLIGPIEAGWIEAGLGALEGLSLTPAGRLDTLALVSFHVRGIVAQESTPHPELTIGTLLLDALGRRANEYPLTAGAFADATAGRATDNAYEFGLERILDGLERFAG
ncbi:TetR/AcrR family transcriptional regulator C-terminal domain-containing protein [Nakamurella sp.]|uniref:TetR/AcrR family transcriptional regulator C-terminal domain-containing protein n=1 Tax=Nakamurella sp. TaxID=1869182 RepID=UPI0037846119